MDDEIENKIWKLIIQNLFYHGGFILLTRQIIIVFY